MYRNRHTEDDEGPPLGHSREWFIPQDEDTAAEQDRENAEWDAELLKQGE